MAVIVISPIVLYVGAKGVYLTNFGRFGLEWCCGNGVWTGVLLGIFGVGMYVVIGGYLKSTLSFKSFPTLKNGSFLGLIVITSLVFGFWPLWAL